MSTAMPDLNQEVSNQTKTSPDMPWVAVLLNDDVNTVGYVIMTLQLVLQKPEDECTALAQEANMLGRSVVFSGTIDEAASVVSEIRASHIGSILEKSGSDD